MDKIISELLAVKLGVLPDDPKAHGMIRAWFEEGLHDYIGYDVPNNSRVSQDARQYAIEALADKELIEKVQDWRVNNG